MRPELLAPAGDLERLKVALDYGADAVYIGGPSYGLRANAVNFTMNDIKKAVSYAHSKNKKVYVTVNIILHNKELKSALKYLKELDKSGVDAIIVSDPTIIDLAHKNTKLDIHISTQQSNLNSESIKFYKSLGATRIVMGREASEKDILSIKKNVNIELECFIHGAMCASYSGRCALSNFFTGRDANRGGCAQICRWDFDLEDTNGNILKGDKKFTFSSKDLSMLKYIPNMIEDGISSFKIEGRMRSAYYLATVVSVYRRSIDSYYDHKFKYDKHDEKILDRVANRESITQFYNDDFGPDTSYYNSNGEPSNQDFLGIVKSYNKRNEIVTVEQRNFFKMGDKVTFFGPNHKDIDVELPILCNIKNKMVDTANHPQELIKFVLPEEVQKGDFMRIKI